MAMRAGVPGKRSKKDKDRLAFLESVVSTAIEDGHKCFLKEVRDTAIPSSSDNEVVADISEEFDTVNLRALTPPLFIRCPCLSNNPCLGWCCPCFRGQSCTRVCSPYKAYEKKIAERERLFMFKEEQLQRDFCIYFESELSKMRETPFTLEEKMERFNRTVRFLKSRKRNLDVVTPVKSREEVLQTCWWECRCGWINKGFFSPSFICGGQKVQYGCGSQRITHRTRGFLCHKCRNGVKCSRHSV